MIERAHTPPIFLFRSILPRANGSILGVLFPGGESLSENPQLK